MAQASDSLLHCHRKRRVHDQAMSAVRSASLPTRCVCGHLLHHMPEDRAGCCQEFGKHGDEWHRLYAGYPSGVYKVNAVEMTEPLAPYELLCGLLVPLYVPRVTEEVLYGRRGVTLQTSREVRRHIHSC